MTGEILAIAVVLGLLAALLIAVPLWRYRARRNATGVLIFGGLLVAIPLTVLSLYTQVTTYPWDNPERLTAPAPGSQAQALEMVAELATRMASEPTVDGLAMLGRSYQALERYEDSVAAWHQAWELTEGKAPLVTINYAEALIFADRESIRTSAGDLIETAIIELPDDPRALWYGGLSAIAKGEMATGQERWARLLNNPDIPPQLRQVVQQQLAAMNAGPAAPATAPRASADAAAALNITVTLAPQLAEQGTRGTTLFVFARDASQPGGPPLAVKRIAANSFPVTVSLSDDDVLIPGRSLADASQVSLTARISQSGDAIAAPGDLYGTQVAQWSGATQQITIVIDSVQGE